MIGRIALLLSDHESLGRARGVRRLSEVDRYRTPPERHGTIVAGNLVRDPFPRQRDRTCLAAAVPSPWRRYLGNTKNSAT